MAVQSAIPTVRFPPRLCKKLKVGLNVILVCIRCFAAHPLSYRHLEEMMQERGVSVDHSTINRWAIRFLSLIEKMARKLMSGTVPLQHIPPFGQQCERTVNSVTS
jgi:hypothetical protein